jgi:WD repeat-containing protein 35
MKQIKMEWNDNGTILALCGTQLINKSQGEEKEVCVVQLYDPYGDLLKSLKVKCANIIGSWN